VWSPDADAGAASFIFEVPEAGAYYLWCRVFAPKGEGSFRAEIDGELFDYEAGGGQRREGTEWTWTLLKDPAGNTPLQHFQAGRHDMVFWGREKETRLDRLVLTSDASFIPNDILGAHVLSRFPARPPVRGPTPVRILLKADRAEVEWPMEQVQDASATVSLASLATKQLGRGLARYRFCLPEGGRFQLWLRVRDSGSLGDSFYVSVDGKDQVFEYGESTRGNWAWVKLPTIVNGKPINPASQHLTSGSHLLVVRGREPRAALDAVLIADAQGRALDGPEIERIVRVGEATDASCDLPAAAVLLSDE